VKRHHRAAPGCAAKHVRRSTPPQPSTPTPQSGSSDHREIMTNVRHDGALRTPLARTERLGFNTYPMDYRQIDNEFTETYARYTSRMDAEDALIDQRMSWLLVSQSILFAALGLGSFAGSDGATETTTFQQVIPWVGAAGALLQWISIMAAVLTELRDRRELIRHYEDRRSELNLSHDDDAGTLPPIGQLLRGLFPLVEPKSLRFYFGFAAPVCIPLVFLVGWSVILSGEVSGQVGI
jgi:hypothetical protein